MNIKLVKDISLDQTINEGHPVYFENCLKMDEGLYDYVLDGLEWHTWTKQRLRTDHALNSQILKKLDIQLPLQEFSELVIPFWRPGRFRWIMGMKLPPEGTNPVHDDMEYDGTVIIYLNPVWDRKWAGLVEFSHLGEPWFNIGSPTMGSVAIMKGHPDWVHRVPHTSTDAPCRVSICLRWEKSK